MEVKFNVWITIEELNGEIDAKALYERLKKHNASVAQVGNTVFVRARLDTYGDIMGDFIKTCREYGNCKIKAKMTRNDNWKGGVNDEKGQETQPPATSEQPAQGYAPHSLAAVRLEQRLGKSSQVPLVP